ncbi:clostripain [Bacteroidales bacterium Barb4]|nr:clostripain [Bacteroidales bacterium Barb4]
MQIKNILLLFVLTVGTVSCCHDLPAVAEPEVSRTVLVYMAADNSLSSFGYSNIDSMMAGAGSDRLKGNLLVYFDPANDTPRLIQIRKGARGVVEKFAVKDYPEQNSASVEVMHGVIDDVINDTRFQADSYGLVLWSHGTAWLPYDWRDRLRSFGQDGSHWMEINELAAALPDDRFDFILFDACYMANVETAYALRHKARHIIASATEVMGNGFPYGQIIEPLFRKTADLEEVCRKFFDYYNNQTGFNRSATVAIINTELLDNLADISRAILQGRDNDISSLPLDQLQLLDYVDGNRHFLYDFDDVMSRLASPEQYRAFQKALSEVVTYKRTTPQATYMLNAAVLDIHRFCGMSVYVPQQAFGLLNEWYEGLEWYGLWHTDSDLHD